MGDGAFSNVYRARDTTGDRGEVAIKVVRKYEMNSMQVSLFGPLRQRCPSPFVFCHRSLYLFSPSPFTNTRGCPPS